MNRRSWIWVFLIVALVGFVIMNPQFRALFGISESRAIGNNPGNDNGDEYELVTLLPKDAIRSIDNPQFVTGAEADAQYNPDELVLGIEINGDARAYSIPFLSGHEIVNDVVGGEPIAVTW